MIAADHGFSTISKESKTSPAAQTSYRRRAGGLAAAGISSRIDLAKALALPLYDPDDKNAAVADGAYPKRGNGLIGDDPTSPMSSSRPTAAPIWSICPARTAR